MWRDEGKYYPLFLWLYVYVYICTKDNISVAEAHECMKILKRSFLQLQCFLKFHPDIISFLLFFFLCDIFLLYLQPVFSNL